MFVSGYQQNITYTGHYALSNQDFLNTSYPIHDGIITDWDAMEQIWYNMYYEDLMASPENYNILHTESLMNSMASRKKLIEVPKSHYNNMYNIFLINRSISKINTEYNEKC